MGYLDFFAAHDDLATLLGWVLTETDAQIWEHYSAPGQSLRRFETVPELKAVYTLGVDPNGHGYAPGLQLWSPAVMPIFPVTRYPLNSRSDVPSFRETLEGGGLIQLYCGGLYGNAITKSHFGHHAQAGAAHWGMADGVDWQALAILSRKIQYHIRKRMAVALIPTRPILPHAYELAVQGHNLTEHPQLAHAYPLPPLLPGKQAAPKQPQSTQPAG